MTRPGRWSLAAVAACLLAQSCGARTAPGSSVKVASGDGWTGYCTGNCGKDGLPVYKDASPTSGVVLMGGSSDVDAAFLWQISKADGGDFLVLRHSGSDGYNDYIYDDLSGETVNSVFSVVLDSVSASSDPVVVAAVQNADALFFAGGDQTLYVERMPLGSPLALALAERAPSITVGGTSAGNDFLSPIIFAPATDAGDITSKIALADPFAYGIDFSATVLHLDSFGTNDSAWFADAHFEERDRMGRDLTFLARLHQDGLVPPGQCARFVAVNERTAMVVERVRLPRGETAVTGATHAYVCELCAAPSTCEAGQPLSAGPYSCLRLSVGDTFMFQDWSSQQGVTYELSVEDGVVVGDAYGPPEQAVASQAEQEAEPLRSCIIPEVVQGVQVTESPVIGVVSQSLEVEMGADPRFAPYKDGSYIMKAYVQWLQAAGARVVPLVRGEPGGETLRKLAGVNGVLFPGGDGDYEEFGRFIFNAVRTQNDAGNYLPLWGTCMGYENMVSYVATAGWNVLDVYDLESASLSLEFVVDPAETSMFGWLGADARLFESHNVAYNSHHWSMDPDRFGTDKGLSSMFRLTSISHMPDGRPIVASIESDTFPFFGTQFHPEKPAALASPATQANHSWVSINLNQNLAERFVFLTRSSTSRLGSFQEVQAEIIENSKLIVTTEFYEAVYVFE